MTKKQGLTTYHIDALEEKLGDNDQVAMQDILNEKRDAEQFIRLVAPEYLGVYVLNKDTDTFRDIIGPDEFRQLVKEHGGHYSAALRVYADNWVDEKDRSIFSYLLDYDKIYETLQTQYEISLSYRKKDNTQIGLRIRSYSRLEEDKNLSIWFYTDEGIRTEEKEEERHRRLSDAYAVAKNANDELTKVVEELKEEKEKLEKALEEAEVKNEIISAIGKSYYYISRIDLEEDYYEIVSGYEKFPETVKREGCMSQGVEANASKLVDEAYVEEFLEFINLATLSERLEKDEPLTLEYRMKNGKWHRACLIIKKRDDKGHVTNVLFAIREITEQKRNEEQMIHKVAEARHEAIEKNRFLSNMSHDIRTPVNGIVGLLDIAEQFPEDLNMQKKCRSKIKELSGYLVTMVGDILEMNRLQSDTLAPQETMIDITELLRTVNEESQRDAVKKNIRYSIDWDKSQINHRYVLGDPLYVQRILKIIADNAIKFSPSGSQVSVWCREEEIDEENVSFSFGCEDHGIGMSKEFLEHAFDLFSQEDEGSRTRYQGIGIGLPIAKKMAEKLHGSISLESKQGLGTKAVTTLLFKIGDLKENGKVEDRLPVSLQGLRALVVEDNELNMEIAKFILEDQEIKVECAFDGKEAVAKFENSEPGHYNMILMDIMMPNLNGRDATRKIRALNRQDARTIPIIAMSANVFPDDIIKNQLAGMNGNLAKPLDGKKLLELVKQCLTKKPL